MTKFFVIVNSGWLKKQLKNIQMKNCLLIVLLAITAKLSANTIVVSSLADLQKEISKAKPGDVILVKKGVYVTTEDVTINAVGTKERPITIAAEETGTAEIAGVGGFNLVSPASYIIIRGFNFTHAASKARSGSGTS